MLTQPSVCKKGPWCVASLDGWAVKEEKGHGWRFWRWKWEGEDDGNHCVSCSESRAGRDKNPTELIRARCCPLKMHGSPIGMLDA